jgi:hypothetical protein
VESWEEGLASLNRRGALLERLPEPSVARRRACQPPSWTAREMPSPLSDAGCTLRPTLRFSVSRSSVTPLGHPSAAQSLAPPSIARDGRSTQEQDPNHVFQATRLPFDPGSPTRRPTWRGFGARCLVRSQEIGRLKHTLIHQRYFQHRAPRVFLSQAGPRFDLGLLQAEHHLWFRRWSIASRNDEGDPLGRPRLACYAAS